MPHLGDMAQLQTQFYRILRGLANTRLFAGLLLWLMVILVTGTIAEKNLGLYIAQQNFFSSYVIWLNDLVPLPGLLSVAVLVFCGLLARLALEYWRWKNAGTIIIHIGAALLLAGGMVTALVSREGVMVIPTGDSRNYMEDPTQVELAIAELNDNDIVAETVVPASQLADGMLNTTTLPFKIDIVSWCRNCALQRLPATVTAGAPHGVALNFVLQDIPSTAQIEDNRAGLTFNITGTAHSDGRYAIFQEMPLPEIITVNNKRYWLTIRHTRTRLPFAIQLQYFKEDIYPGTDKPRAYQSDVIINDNGIMWPSRIKMNEPLRYKGYTFYQSSFQRGDGRRTATVLSVVKNAGRLFPYLAGLIIAAGFVIHLVQRLIWRQRMAAS